MEKYDIIRVDEARYLYKKWRYTNLRDAIAQAERDVIAESCPVRREYPRG
jgi:hypothetical protein